MLREIGEMESIGDSFYNVARIFRRKRENKIDFTDAQTASLHDMYHLVEEAILRMNECLAGQKKDYDIAISFEIESRINALRNQLKQSTISDVDNHIYSYDSGTIFMDLIGEFEKTGDYIINVAEARMGASHRDI
jgi:phosphate:Na+ symporter